MSSQSQIKGLAQSGTPAVVPEGSLWYDTTNDILKASDGSAYNNIGKTSFAGAAVVSHTTTIGDYTTPTAATGSSGLAEGDAVFGLATTATIETFATYTTQGEADAVWAPQDTTNARVNITNDNLAYTSKRDTTNDAIVFDLGTISDTTWALRFKWVITSVTNASASESNEIIGLFSGAGTVAGSTAQDYIGFSQYWNTSTKKIYTAYGDGEDIQAGGIRAELIAAVADGTTYYAEIKRTSATAVTYTLYSDSSYTTVVATSTATVAATTATLRYFGYKNVTGGGTITGGFVGTIDDVMILRTATGPFRYDGVFDNSTSTKWTSSSENNPNIYVDMGSALNLCAVAIYWDNTSTETEIKIQSSADAITWTDKRKITTSNLTNGAYNYYRFNIAGGARYLRIYGTGTSKVLKLWEIKVLKKTDAEIFTDLGTVEISNSDTALDGDGV